ncbi:flagellar hook-basal body complex protein FliE [Alkalibacillus filiformis]|uniref:Flagellar hook-basal body complex protein FliE n=1 Tax=Alkalibacillus filiformis TaxID=200990 RepID=A0ABU0DQ90_9BACI|nr:flagellar hook-basal body complex protein FliE [Alkalibacillus filiformis]MDQ0350617.1 flagellar hook-basal body complex protein FliE [Alkalibacillus filiformis]
MKPIESNIFSTGMNSIASSSNQDKRATASEVQQSFANELKNAINEVNKTQQESNAQTNALINGDAQDLHNVMISAEKASVTLQTATEIQNTAIEAYQKVMRMQL